MNTLILSVDRDTLPAALLPAFKRWSRVNWVDDDLLLTEILQGAIDQFERNSEITVFKSVFILQPEVGDFCGSDLRLPVTPINSISIGLDQVPHSDETFLGDFTGYAVISLSADYQLRARGLHGVRIYHLIGAFQDGLAISIDTGFEFAKLTPEIRQTVFQIAGHLYEYREIFVPSNIGEPPMWLNQIMGGFWLPRV
jgi:hypothetical protein